MSSFADFVNFLGLFVRAADGTWRSHSRRARALGRGDLRGPSWTTCGPPRKECGQACHHPRSPRPEALQLGGGTGPRGPTAFPSEKAAPHRPSPPWHIATHPSLALGAPGQGYHVRCQPDRGLMPGWCGEVGGNPALSRNRDHISCVEVGVPGHRWGVVSGSVWGYGSTPTHVTPVLSREPSSGTLSEEKRHDNAFQGRSTDL